MPVRLFRPMTSLVVSQPTSLLPTKATASRPRCSSTCSLHPPHPSSPNPSTTRDLESRPSLHEQRPPRASCSAAGSAPTPSAPGSPSRPRSAARSAAGCSRLPARQHRRKTSPPTPPPTCQGLDYQYQEINPYEEAASGEGYTKKALPLEAKRERYPDFVDASPWGLVPALHDAPEAGGAKVCDSMVVLRYLEDAYPTTCPLLPAGAAQRAASHAAPARAHLRHLGGRVASLCCAAQSSATLPPRSMSTRGSHTATTESSRISIACSCGKRRRSATAKR